MTHKCLLAIKSNNQSKFSFGDTWMIKSLHIDHRQLTSWNRSNTKGHDLASDVEGETSGVYNS